MLPQASCFYYVWVLARAPVVVLLTMPDPQVMARLASLARMLCFRSFISKFSETNHQHRLLLEGLSIVNRIRL